MIKILKFATVIEANFKIAGGIVGGTPTNVPFEGLVGTTITFTNPVGAWTFTPGTGQPGQLFFSEVRTQLEANIANLVVETVDNKVGFRHAVDGQSVSLGALDEVARLILGFSNPVGGVAIAGQFLNPPDGPAPRYHEFVSEYGAVYVATSDSDAVFVPGPVGPSGPPGGTTVTYWFHDDNSDVALYKKLLTEPANDPIEDDMNVSVVHADGEKLLEHAHVTDPGFPGVTLIPAGTWSFSIYRNASVAGVAAIVFRVYKRDLANVETELFNFTTGIITDAVVTRQTINVSQPAITLLATDRIVVKPFATNTQAFAVTVHMYHDGALHDSLFSFPYSRIITVSDTTALATSLLANVPITTGVYVTSRSRIYWSVPAGQGDIAGTGNDWKSDSSTSSPAWLTQATWELSNVGNDDNDGTHAHPLLTMAEIQNRLGSNPILPQSTFILFQTNHPGGILRVGRASAAVVVEVAAAAGAITVLANDTVNTYTAISSAANTWEQLKGTAIADYAAYVDKRITYTSGVANGQSHFIARSNPQGAGTNAVELVGMSGTPPTLANNYAPAFLVPVGGVTFNIEQLPVIDYLVIEVMDAGGNKQNGATAENRPAYLIKGLQVTFLGGRANGNGSRSRYIWGCFINNWSDQTATFRTALIQCSLFSMTQTRVQSAIYQFSAFKSADPANITSIFLYDSISLSTVLFEGVAVSMLLGAVGSAGLGIFNAPGAAALTIGQAPNTNCQMAISTQVLGQGNAGVGVVVYINSVLVLNAGCVAKLTGATGDWKFQNSASIFTWAQTPRRNNQGSFADTLGVGGTKVVTIPFLPADARVWAHPTTPSGVGAPGVFSIPTAGRAASSVTVNSTVAADRSTFEGGWFSESGGTGGVVAG